MKFSAHFCKAEFEGHDQIPEGALPCFIEMCERILEQIRSRFNAPVVITSGYRSPEHNAAVGGKHTSQHIASAEHCACDFKIPGVEIELVFDWIRLDSNLRFDQLILEHNAWGELASVIHISYTRQKARREALEGLTHGRSHYIARTVGHHPIAENPELWGEA